MHRLITMGSSSGAPTLMGPAGLTEGLKVLQKGYRQPSFDTLKELVDVMTFDSKFALLFHGRDDRVVHFEHSLRLTSMLRNFRLYLINGCGHWLQIEHADEFTEQVLHFLAS